MKSTLASRSVSFLLKGGLILLFAGLVLALTPQPAESLISGYGLTWTVWPFEPVKLVVCWENPSAAEPLGGESDQTSGAERREWVRLAVKRTWERYSRVIFVGWDTCQNEDQALDPPHTLGPRRPGTGDENLKILITYSGGGQNPGHGSWGDYQKDGVILNLHCGGVLKDCIEYLAIHEFGHTLGLYHGEERSDWPDDIPGCPRQTWPPSDPWWPIPTEMLFGAPDTNSIMAYCSGQPTDLSPKDIAGIQRVYTRHLPGTVLSASGSLCLSSHAEHPNGDPVFGWECDEAKDDQEWKCDRQQYALQIFTPQDTGGSNPRCLDVDTVSGSKVQTWDCQDTPNQQWTFRRVEIRGYGGLCMTRTGPGEVSLQACTQSTDQLWRLTPGDREGSFNIRSETENLCLATTGIPGSLVSTVPCELGHPIYLPLVHTNQNPLSLPNLKAKVQAAAAEVSRDFFLNPGGQIGIPFGDQVGAYCVDVRDVWNADYLQGQGGPVEGQQVQVFQCLPDQINQRWNLSGDIMSAGKCLGLSGDPNRNGAAAAVSNCDNSIEQDWDYYW